MVFPGAHYHTVNVAVVEPHIGQLVITARPDRLLGHLADAITVNSIMCILDSGVCKLSVGSLSFAGCGFNWLENIQRPSNPGLMI